MFGQVTMITFAKLHFHCQVINMALVTLINALSAWSKVYDQLTTMKKAKDN